ncbi:hypothetical protein SERLA73DRAFT_175342 [Serpula lacrymans var. lacrymans S7.3]|uniref:Uncharacterized protein n=2 Tax=Serpula lacrymans var. lacrymans TaxID=341189 RepID=F8PJA6_SERL3|nr:uncharacterized protein SERLADRAFT_457556 [Serpula lacrymans var. lacrymans S7.9]EGO03731.1 hypothetical protein SERLA73DRAFT_175342 [Serpula lacrymans var. lacrymans S7.3]EGO29597.1 hypothetical protein SERLADRAFT_457556 [Serpula lacrymans var. lacrymans S7.9]
MIVVTGFCQAQHRISPFLSRPVRPMEITSPLVHSNFTPSILLLKSRPFAGARVIGVAIGKNIICLTERGGGTADQQRNELRTKEYPQFKIGDQLQHLRIASDREISFDSSEIGCG